MNSVAFPAVRTLTLSPLREAFVKRKDIELSSSTMMRLLLPIIARSSRLLPPDKEVGAMQETLLLASRVSPAIVEAIWTTVPYRYCFL